MKITIALISLTILSNSTFSQSADFKNQPWTKDFPIVLDAYRLNKIDYNSLKKETKVKAIIFKASDGLIADSKYKESIKTAKENGFLTASYHLGRKGEPIKQAEFYLAQIGKGNNEPMALDIEDIGGNNISLPDAEIFIEYIFKKTNKYPLIYVNNKVFNAINQKYDRNSSFAKCKLWYARFLEVLPTLSIQVWDKVSLWQFACEINCQLKDSKKDNPSCPMRIAGTANDMDINAFNGSLEELKKYWNK